MLVALSCLRVFFGPGQKRYHLRNLRLRNRILMIDCTLEELMQADELLPEGWMAELVECLLDAHHKDGFKLVLSDTLPSTLEYDAEKGVFSLGLDVTQSDDDSFVFTAPSSDTPNVVFEFTVFNEVDLPVAEFDQSVELDEEEVDEELDDAGTENGDAAEE